jgi:hypothetical protein
MGRQKRRRGSLPPGIAVGAPVTDARLMSAAVLTKVAPAASQRILEDVSALAGHRSSSRWGMPKQPASDRLEAAIGRDFADRLVAALSDKSGPNRR